MGGVGEGGGGRRWGELGRGEEVGGRGEGGTMEAGELSDLRTLLSHIIDKFPASTENLADRDRVCF